MKERRGHNSFLAAFTLSNREGVAWGRSWTQQRTLKAQAPAEGHLSGSDRPQVILEEDDGLLHFVLTPPARGHAARSRVFEEHQKGPSFRSSNSATMASVSMSTSPATVNFQVSESM